MSAITESNEFDEIIRIKDLRIQALLAEIQLLKENAQTHIFRPNVDTLDDLEISVDNNEFSGSITLKPPSVDDLAISDSEGEDDDDDDDDEEEKDEGSGGQLDESSIMNLLNMIMGGMSNPSENNQSAAANPLMGMMQQMMAGANGLENPGDNASAAAASVANPFLEMMQQMMSRMDEPEATPSSEDDNSNNNESEPFMNLEAE